MLKATAVACSNIALVKYWGKRDERLVLPYNSSISVTCDGLWTRTTVEFRSGLSDDVIVVNNVLLQEDDKNIGAMLDRVRMRAGIELRARIESMTNFPVAVGLASSASGLAALTAAAVRAAGVALSSRELSILTRELSGSACRSLVGGFAEWYRGEAEDGSDSFAETLFPAEHWPSFRLLAVVVSEARKVVGSRIGMSRTVLTSPYYEGWLASVAADLSAVREAIADRDIRRLGEIAERNALKMHALMFTTVPPLLYWLPETLVVAHAVRELRDEGLGCYFTIDAGPQVKVVCEAAEAEEIRGRLAKLPGVQQVINCRPGPGVRYDDLHLF